MKKIWVIVGISKELKPIHFSDIRKIYYFKKKRTPNLPKLTKNDF